MFEMDGGPQCKRHPKKLGGLANQLILVWTPRI